MKFNRMLDKIVFVSEKKQKCFDNLLKIGYTKTKAVEKTIALCFNSGTVAMK